MWGKKLQNALAKPEHLRDVKFDMERVPLHSYEAAYVEPDTLLARINDHVNEDRLCVLREVETGVPDIQRYEVMQYGLKHPRATIEIKAWQDSIGAHETIYFRVEHAFRDADGIVGKLCTGHTISLAVTKNGSYSFRRDDHAFPQSDTKIPSAFLLNMRTRAKLNTNNIAHGCYFNN